MSYDIINNKFDNDVGIVDITNTRRSFGFTL